jgi:hypothetical protein
MLPNGASCASRTTVYGRGRWRYARYVDPTATQREGSSLPQLNYGRDRVVQDAGAIDVSMPRRRRRMLLLALRPPP